MSELELTEEELEVMDIRAAMSIEISDIWLEMLTAEQNQDRERMATAIARLERLEAVTGAAQGRYARGLSRGVPQGVSK
jgi:hypothetical protein